MRPPSTNHEALAALSRCSDHAERQSLRGQLVRNNLPLVYAIVARMGPTPAIPQEDLRQIGSLGLLRAIDAFEPSQGRTLSSFAVPYIRGAIQHELRDRASLMRIPRPLWELRRRATVLQDRRRRLGQTQLAPAQLAEALDCPISQVVEALQVSAVVDMRSLDASGSGDGGEEGPGRTLLEQLPDPASLTEAATADAPAAGPIAALLAAAAHPGCTGGSIPPAPAPAQAVGAGPAAAVPSAELRPRAAEPCLPTGWPVSPEVTWLQQRLLGLSELERWLVMGHVCAGRSWVELARDLGLHPRRVQRRTVALIARLQAEGQRWRDDSGAAATSA